MVVNFTALLAEAVIYKAFNQPMMNNEKFLNYCIDLCMWTAFWGLFCCIFPTKSFAPEATDYLAINAVHQSFVFPWFLLIIKSLLLKGLNSVNDRSCWCIIIRFFKTSWATFTDKSYLEWLTVKTKQEWKQQYRKDCCFQMDSEK